MKAIPLISPDLSSQERTAEYVTLSTRCGQIRGISGSECNAFLGIRFAKAERFRYPEPVSEWQGEYDATAFGDSCTQYRTWFAHLDDPERRFYYHEFREGRCFNYSEDCLNLNIYTPKVADAQKPCPVIVFIHGGGFNSGAASERPFDGAGFAKRGVILVTIQYRVGVLGYLTHEELQAEYGHDGNFGLYDQLTAVKWVKDNIADYGGDPECITLMGQSAGAISIQYLLLCERSKGLFKRVIMMSGAGKFPNFALPKRAPDTHEYWLQLMQLCGCTTLDELRRLDSYELLAGVEKLKQLRKDNVYNTMPVIDGTLLTDNVQKLIKDPLPADNMIGYTNNDMYAVLMGYIGHKYADQNNAYIYYFDIDAPGPDNNGAFHSSDLRYAFGTLAESDRPYSQHDYEVSELLQDYLADFARSGDPNSDKRPHWQRGGKKALRFADSVRMSSPHWCKLLINTVTKGSPKYRGYVNTDALN